MPVPSVFRTPFARRPPYLVRAWDAARAPGSLRSVASSGSPARRAPVPRAPLALAWLGLLAAVGLATAARAEQSLPLAVPADPQLRLVTVTGQGEVRASPDRATVTLGVMTRQPTVEQGRAEANRVVERLLALTRELRIPAERVRSTRVSVNPEYAWNEPRRERQLLGYTVQRQLVIDLREIERLGELMEKAVTAGANLVGEPQLDSTRRKDLEREALALAVQDAQQNAAVVAGSAGGRVGPPRNLSSTGSVHVPVPMYREMAVAAARMDAAEAPGTWQSGELTFTAQVTATFDLVAGGGPAAATPPPAPRR